MVHERYITQKKYNEAIATQLNYRQPNASIRAPHFVFYVKNQLEQEFGPRMVQEGGLNVYTTLDYSMQKTIEQILSEEIDSLQTLQVGNGAVLVTQPSTGEILAMVGSKDFFEGNSGAFNVTTGYRQPGSSIKPITYTLALKRGITAASLVADVPTKFYVSSSESYSPVNYDSKFHGLIPVRYALANSYNIPAVKMLEYVGVGNFIGFANRMGITTWESQRDRFGLSLTLGGGEVTMLEMATAYGTIRNLGIRKDLTPFRSVQNSIGQELYRASNSDVRAISEEEPFIVSDILSDNVARTWAFGPNSVLNFGNGLVSVK
ncbi:MAG: transglycosylase domain-containing protein, partial [Patescibacteria group bacterium]